MVNKAQCLANLKRMIDKTAQHGLAYRPHFKTHQSQAVGQWHRELGITAITVSSLKMAEYFADDDWADITVAFPTNRLEHARINRIAAKATLNLLFMDAATVQALDQQLKRPINALIKVDTGYHRTGLPFDDLTAIDAVLAAIDAATNITFKGFLAHAGHTYHVRGRAAVHAINRQTVEAMQQLKANYQQQYPGLICSIGDTPSLSIAEDFDGMDEARPGNLLFYDLQQHFIGSCSTSQIAVALACPVVATDANRLELVVHGGAVHLSKDSVTDHEGLTFYGYVVQLNADGWQAPIEGMYVKKLSQEHGIIQCTEATFNRFTPGDVLGILPAHSCLTADNMKQLTTLTGEVLGMM